MTHQMRQEQRHTPKSSNSSGPGQGERLGFYAPKGTGELIDKVKDRYYLSRNRYILKAVTEALQKEEKEEEKVPQGAGVPISAPCGSPSSLCVSKQELTPAEESAQVGR